MTRSTILAFSLTLALATPSFLKAAEYYNHFTPQLIAQQESPLTIHAAYYKQSSSGVDWKILATFKEDFVTFIPEKDHQHTLKYEKPSCKVSNYRFEDRDGYDDHSIDIGHRGFSSPDTSHRVVSQWEGDKFKVFATHESAVLYFKCNRVSKKDIGDGLNKFFKEIKKGLTIAIPENAILVDWVQDFKEIRPYLNSSPNHLWADHSPYKKRLG